MRDQFRLVGKNPFKINRIYKYSLKELDNFFLHSEPLGLS